MNGMIQARDKEREREKERGRERERERETERESKRQEHEKEYFSHLLKKLISICTYKIVYISVCNMMFGYKYKGIGMCT